MINLSDKDYVIGIQSNLHATFDTPQGKEVMKFLETIGSWYPNVYDSIETNDVVARDANRTLIGTIKTLLEQKADDIVLLAQQGG
jgi:hypothetical protein